MKTMQLGTSNLNASVVSIGAFGIGGGNTWSDTSVTVNSVSSLLDAAIDLGVNLIDTAPVYGLGNSEEILGKALKGRRDKFLIQTKGGLNWRDAQGQLEYVRDGKHVYRNLGAASIRKDLEDCLRRLQTDCIDIFITHRQSDQVPVEETMGELMKLIGEGKMRAVGISNASPEILRAYWQVGPVALVQEKFSILAPGNGKEYIPACEEMGTSFQVYASLEAGALTGPQNLGRSFPDGDVRQKNRWFSKEMQPSMQALFDGWKPLTEKYNCSYSNLVQAWTLRQSKGLNLLTGVRHIESLMDTCRAVDIELSDEELASMQADCEKLIHS